MLYSRTQYRYMSTVFAIQSVAFAIRRCDEDKQTTISDKFMMTDVIATHL